MQASIRPSRHEQNSATRHSTNIRDQTSRILLQAARKHDTMLGSQPHRADGVASPISCHVWASARKPSGPMGHHMRIGRAAPHARVLPRARPDHDVVPDSAPGRGLALMCGRLRRTLMSSRASHRPRLPNACGRLRSKRQKAKPRRQIRRAASASQERQSRRRS